MMIRKFARFCLKTAFLFGVLVVSFYFALAVGAM